MKPINVKVLETGPTGTPGHWYYGPDHMVRISKSDARKLCGMYPLPEMGYSVTVAIKPDPVFSSFWYRLDVQNVSGDYFLACTNVTKDQWVEVFGVCAK